MTSFSSPQDKPFEIKQYNVINETYTYRDLLPTETTTSHTVTLQPPKIYSFGDNLDGYDSLKRDTQTVTPLSTDLKPVSLEPTDITSRLDQLLKNAETALAKSKKREGNLSTYQPIATAPLTDIDSGLSLNSAEVQRRAGMYTIPNATVPQKYTSQPLDLGHSLSLSSAELYNKTPVTLIPNATSHRYINLDFQNNEYINNLGSTEAHKKTGLDSALKYSPIPYSQTHDSEFISTKRSLLAGHENSQPLHKEEPQITTTTYETYTTNHAKTLPRSYNLFPIQESERPSHISQVEQNHEVQALKSGISNIEDLLRTLDHTTIGSAPYKTQAQPSSITNFASQDLYSKPISNPQPLDTYGDTTPNFSATYSIKPREFESATEQPKKSFAVTTDFSTSSNYYQINPSTYSKTPERQVRHERSFEQEQTDQAMKNIDHLMQRHLFEKSPLRKSPVTKNSTLRYMSPTRASGSPNPHLQNYENQRHWELINRSAEVSQPSIYVEKERRASPDLYRRSSLQTTPTPKDQQIYHQDFLQPSQTSYIQESQYVTKTPNTHSPMTKEIGLPQSYGSKTNYKEYYSPKTEKFLYRPSPGTSPYSPYIYENYEKTEKSYVNNYGAGNEQYEGVADRYQDYGNPDVLNSADRKMKKLTLRAKSPEDSERKDGQRYTPSAKRDLQNAEGVFSEDDASQFDFHNSGHDDHHSYGKPSPKALPNTYKAGELIPDREDPVTRQGVYNKFNSGDLQQDPNMFNSGELQHDPNAFNAGELQNDPQANQIQTSFKAGDLQADYDSPYKNPNVHQPLKGDQGVEDFRAGELQDDQSPEKVQRNIADDGRAWQMVHKVSTQMFDSPDHSFDFDSENAQYQQQMEEAAKMSKNRPRVQDPKPQQQRIVDPHLWVVDVPQAEAANLSKSSQVLKQSVKKAQRKPIIAYCFDKFEKRNFSTSQ